MAYERIMGVNVSDEAQYQLYREAMEPLLINAQGAFGYDFKIDQTLRSKTDTPINRVFTIEFPTKQDMDAFFCNPLYLTIKQQYFDNSVNGITIISMHEKP